MEEQKNNTLIFLKKLPPMTKGLSKKIPINIEKDEKNKKKDKTNKKTDKTNKKTDKTNKKTDKKKNKKTNKRRKCSFEGCNIKLKITSLECRCKATFCVKHFAAEKHKCTFDYKKSGRENIIKKGSLDGCKNDKFFDRI